LRHVRRRHVAALETRLRGGERLAQGRHIDALGLDQALVGEHVGIGGHRVKQYALAGIAQRLAPREHLRLRLANGIGGLEAVEQGLRHGEPDGPGAQRLGLNGVVEKQHPHLLQAAGQGGQELRAVSRKRLRDAFVGPALARAFGIELRIILISPHQRFWQRFRPHRLDCQRAHDGGNDRGRTARTKDAAHRGQRSDDARPTVRTQYADRYAHRYDPNVDKSA